MTSSDSATSREEETSNGKKHEETQVKVSPIREETCGEKAFLSFPLLRHLFQRDCPCASSSSNVKFLTSIPSSHNHSVEQDCRRPLLPSVLMLLVTTGAVVNSTQVPVRRKSKNSSNSFNKNSHNTLAAIMMPVMISMIMRSLLVSGQNCFGGIETFEKVSMTDFDDNYSPAGILLQQMDTALTRDCINLCKQQPSCLSFGLDYTKFRCAAYSINSVGRRLDLISTNTTNYFEKVCYRGIARDEYERVCGIERLWSFERVVGGFLEGFEKIQLNNVASRSECAKACLMESTFTCRSADYDEILRICRLSKEDRRSQPQAFKVVPGSNREYLENQCAAPGKRFDQT